MQDYIEVYWTAGQNTKVGQEILLETGEVKSLVNADLSTLGVLAAAKTLDTMASAANAISSIIVTPSGSVWFAHGPKLDSFDPSTNNSINVLSDLVPGLKVRSIDYKNWLYLANGKDKRKIYMADQSVHHQWGIPSPTVAPEVDSATLVTNGEFATDVASWTAGASAVLDSVAGGATGNCLRITESGADNRYAYQDITTVLGQTYRFKIRVKTGTEATWRAWKSDTDDSDVVDVDDSGLEAGADWEEHTCSFVATDTTSRLHLQQVAVSGAATTIYFDSARLFLAANGPGTGIYSCYYAWVAKYPDLSEYETDLSPPFFAPADPGSSYSWENFPSVPSAYTSEIGYRRLYRELNGEILLIAEIPATDLQYTDTTSDGDLVTSSAFARTGYYPPPDQVWCATEHYRRIFVLVDSDAYGHCLFWSEPEEPQAFIFDSDTGLYANWTDVFRHGDQCTGLVSWGEQLYIASRTTFKRLVGSSPNYWALRPTLTQIGNVARYALMSTKYGILHLWWDGIYLFNGYNSSKITAKNEQFFSGINWTSADKIESTFDGKTYRLLVPYGNSEVNNRSFVIDFEAYPRLRCYEETHGESCAAWDCRNNTTWYASGTEFGQRDGDDVVSFVAWSKSFPTGRLVTIDGAYNLNYEIDTGGEDVTLTVYYDRVAHPMTVTLNTSERTRDTTSIPYMNARTISLKISGNVSNAIKIYDPWILGGG